ncbi:hypothetical protein LF845_03150 [Deferribacterales bacterium Es71-Z0220]|uniref:hypothetical protein n=1 Tax=Deferrivibrio essentukiensis TaxID=2880922 RepID=UPI001F6038BD|nr:hypothetical protein [Deferrivibrio essentukiensis]MCB4203955.1 hypothetical protein [Deferrivibrio essentukiensis]
MNKKVTVFLYFAVCFNIGVIVVFCALLLKNNSDAIDRLKTGVRLTTLPDSALVTEARFIRHRSLSDIYSIFDFSPEVREVFPMSFLYMPSTSYNSEKALQK